MSTLDVDQELAALKLILLRDDLEQVAVCIAGRTFRLDPTLLQALLRQHP